MYHLIQTDYNVGLYRRRRCKQLLRERLGTKPKLWMNHRLKLFKKFTVPSLLRQTCQSWSWVIRVDHQTPSEDLDAIIEVVGDRASITTDKWDEVISSVSDGLDVPLLTTRLDNDDMLQYDAIDTIQETARQQSCRCVIDMPSGYNYDSIRNKLYYYNKFFDSGDVTHFSSLIELTKPFVGIHKYPRHKKLKELFPVINIDGWRWVEVCHRMNIKNRPSKLYGEAQFERLQDFW